ncbi:hypothetical protein B0T26DRAFT_519182 [Lasiosphaeria miniovina]|uniref:Uncharacterized protein n=1 Tax=Lasiosphaeria miniovina TaxID=1954250 RepID=A0AA39ZUS9_9PEZI|nr:uncharacterized protein B0T26DRAFT_519182 [Lasiosphaeria miniovina]KAK0703988.1 hypothetical protein B0T26DRAFT_519182 [Lasiosphaeria miniovina]
MMQPRQEESCARLGISLRSSSTCTPSWQALDSRKPRATRICPRVPRPTPIALEAALVDPKPGYNLLDIAETPSARDWRNAAVFHGTGSRRVSDCQFTVPTCTYPVPPPLSASDRQPYLCRLDFPRTAPKMPLFFIGQKSRPGRDFVMPCRDGTMSIFRGQFYRLDTSFNCHHIPPTVRLLFRARYMRSAWYPPHTPTRYVGVCMHIFQALSTHPSGRELALPFVGSRFGMRVAQACP